jgi:hypothetical protein
MSTRRIISSWNRIIITPIQLQRHSYLCRMMVQHAVPLSFHRRVFRAARQSKMTDLTFFIAMAIHYSIVRTIHSTRFLFLTTQLLSIRIRSRRFVNYSSDQKFPCTSAANMMSPHITKQLYCTPSVHYTGDLIPHHLPNPQFNSFIRIPMIPLAKPYNRIIISAIITIPLMVLSSFCNG